jgi:hypothetical protein
MVYESDDAVVCEVDVPEVELWLVGGLWCYRDSETGVVLRMVEPFEC